jgi:hypothetical protein
MDMGAWMGKVRQRGRKFSTPGCTFPLSPPGGGDAPPDLHQIIEMAICVFREAAAIATTVRMTVPPPHLAGCQQKGHAGLFIPPP